MQMILIPQEFSAHEIPGMLENGAFSAHTMMEKPIKNIVFKTCKKWATLQGSHKMCDKFCIEKPQVGSVIQGLLNSFQKCSAFKGRLQDRPY
jgi:hypothetical protein